MSSQKLIRNAAIAVGVVASTYALFPRTAAKALPDKIETPAMGTIADRWSAGGGSQTHTPGAATPRGQSDQTASPQHHSTKVDTKEFQDRVAEQSTGQKQVSDRVRP